MNLADKIHPSHTALIVIDIQNDFCSPTGMLGRMGKNVTGIDNMIKNLQEFIIQCENVSIPVLYTQQLYDRHHLTALQKEQYDLDGRIPTCDVSGNGGDFYIIRPPKDRIYKKYTYNIFSNRNLKKYLKDHGIKTLIITGVSTQICVETAVRNGYDLGYKIVVPADLTATTSSTPSRHTSSLAVIEKTYGVVTSSNELLGLLKNYTS